MAKRLLMVMMVVLTMAATVQAAQVGDQTTHRAGGVEFHMRFAPAATFPTGLYITGSATVGRAFWIAETEVTYELWYTVRQWALRNGYTFANAGREGSNGRTGQAPTSKRNEPVTTVSWRDSIVWCNALSEMLGLDPVYTWLGNVIKDATDATACDYAVQEDSTGFRLPTSAEWELAARYRDGRSWTPDNYASGASASTDNAAATQAVAWYKANAGGSTKNVGLKRANGLGLYDMSGNVSEWTYTWRPRRGGIIRSTGFGPSQVLRGGSWYTGNLNYLQVGRVNGLNSFTPDYVGIDNPPGLRLARTCGVHAQFQMGMRYVEGRGVEQNNERAVHWFRLAADQGHAEAQYSLGIMYIHGDGVTQDFSRAAHWLTLAGEQGHAEAQYSLGIMYIQGHGVTQDYSQAVQWLTLAGEQGYSEAQYNLGIMYIQGHGVAQDFSRAAHWLTKAGEQGHAEAQYAMGFMYIEGFGVTQDYSQSLYWFQLSAEQAHADALFALGIMYAEGLGIAEDVNQAVHYVTLAARQGHADAQEALREQGLRW